MTRTKLPPHQPSNPPAKTTHCAKRFGNGGIRNIAPSERNLNACLGLIQRSKRRLTMF